MIVSAALGHASPVGSLLFASVVLALVTLAGRVSGWGQRFAGWTKRHPWSFAVTIGIYWGVVWGLTLGPANGFLMGIVACLMFGLLWRSRVHTSSA